MQTFDNREPASLFDAWNAAVDIGDFATAAQIWNQIWNQIQEQQARAESEKMAEIERLESE